MKSLKISQRTADLSEKSVMYYFNTISKQPTITSKEEKELIARIQLGDKEAIDRLVCSNLRFVISVAKQYQNQGLDFADLIEEGNLGLIKAAERFNSNKENKFISYAVWWIRDSIQSAIHNNGRTIRLPKSVYNAYKDIIDFRNRYEYETGETCSFEEIAEGIGLSSSEVEEILASELKERSLDAFLYDDDELSLKDTIAQDSVEETDIEFEKSDMSTLINLTLKKVLKERDAYIIRQFFGFDGERKSAQEIGEELNLTRERVRQILNESFAKIRESRLGQELRLCC